MSCPNVEGYKNFKLRNQFGKWGLVANIPVFFLKNHQCAKVEYTKGSRSGNDVFFGITNTWTDKNSGELNIDNNAAYYNIKEPGLLRFNRDDTLSGSALINHQKTRDYVVLHQSRDVAYLWGCIDAKAIHQPIFNIISRKSMSRRQAEAHVNNAKRILGNFGYELDTESMEYPEWCGL